MNVLPPPRSELLRGAVLGAAIAIVARIMSLGTHVALPYVVTVLALTLAAPALGLVAGTRVGRTTTEGVAQGAIAGWLPTLLLYVVTALLGGEGVTAGGIVLVLVLTTVGGGIGWGLAHRPATEGGVWRKRAFVVAVVAAVGLLGARVASSITTRVGAIRSARAALDARRTAAPREYPFAQLPVHVDSGACIDRCCQYGPWRARREVTLLARPDGYDGPRIVVDSGADVRALWGAVHVYPAYFVTSADVAPHRAGDTLEVYTPRGDGWFDTRRKGSSAPLAPSRLVPDTTRSCVPGGHCPGYFVNAHEPSRRWWVRVETSRGDTAWTSATQSFEGSRFCP